MTALVLLLPVSWQPRAKAIVAAILSALTILSLTVVAVPTWVTVALAVLTAAGVHEAPAPGYVAPTGEDVSGPAGMLAG